MFRKVKASFKLAAFIFMTVAIIPIQFIMIVLFKKQDYVIPVFYAKALNFILGVQINTYGQKMAKSQTLFVSNHISYLDIPVLGSLIHGSFVAKSDVASWPLFGLLAKLRKTVFIDRTKAGTKEGNNQIETYINQGRNLILFPEGTSSEGTTVLPFKSSFFKMAIDNENCEFVQPVTLRIKNIEGEAVEKNRRYDDYAWYGDMTLSPHLWNFFGLSGVTIDVIFHTPIPPRHLSNRKELAKHCEEEVKKPFNPEYWVDFQNNSSNVAA